MKGNDKSPKNSQVTTQKCKRRDNRVSKGPQYKLKKGAQILGRLRRWNKRARRMVVARLLRNDEHLIRVEEA